MPRISPSVSPSTIETTASLAAAEPKVASSTYRNRIISLSTTRKSVNSLLRAVGRGISAKWASLFKGKSAVPPNRAAVPHASETAKLVSIKSVSMEREARAGAGSAFRSLTTQAEAPQQDSSQQETLQNMSVAKETISPAPAMQEAASADPALQAETIASVVIDIPAVETTVSAVTDVIDVPAVETMEPVLIDVPAADTPPPAVTPSEPEAAGATPLDASDEVTTPNILPVRQLLENIESRLSRRSAEALPRQASRGGPFRSDAYARVLGVFNAEGTGLRAAPRALDLTFPELQRFITSARAGGDTAMRLAKNGMGSVLPLADAAAAWYPPEMREKVLADWRGVLSDNAPGMKAISEFLCKLGGTHLQGGLLKNNESFKGFVQVWLTQLADSPELLVRTEHFAYQATQRCPDGILKLFNQMQEPRLAIAVEKGEYNGRLPDLVEAARQLFRRQQLGELAIAKVERNLDEKMRSPGKWLPRISPQKLAQMSKKEIRSELRENSEELETHLHMEVGNIKKLRLKFPFATMHYAGSSGLNAGDLAAAASRVKDLENSNFADWLSDWTPWNTFMEVNHPAEFAEMKSRKNTIAAALLENLDAEVLAEIADLKKIGALPAEKTPEAERAVNNANVRLSNEKWQSVGPRAMQLAMQEFVEKLGHAGIMDPRWSTAA